MTDHGELIEAMTRAMRGADESLFTPYCDLAQAALDALTAAGWAVVKLPAPESSGCVDDDTWWSFPWGVDAISTGHVTDDTGCELTPDDARSIAASWLAAAQTAEDGEV